MIGKSARPLHVLDRWLRLTILGQCFSQSHFNFGRVGLQFQSHLQKSDGGDWFGACIPHHGLHVQMLRISRLKLARFLVQANRLLYISSAVGGHARGRLQPRTCGPLRRCLCVRQGGFIFQFTRWIGVALAQQCAGQRLACQWILWRLACKCARHQRCVLKLFGVDQAIHGGDVCLHLTGRNHWRGLVFFARHEKTN